MILPVHKRYKSFDCAEDCKKCTAPSLNPFLMVEGLEALHSLIKKSGWEQVSDIYTQPWGARECSVTTIDGSILRFFETDSQVKE